MRKALRHVLLLAALGLAVGLLAAGSSLAASGGGGGYLGLRDTSHQLWSLQTRMDDLLANGGFAKTGTLSALENCGYDAGSQIFRAWGDLADYSLAPGGDLATTDGWTLGNVTVDPAHDPYSAAAASLRFAGGGATAESPVACVDLANPTIRFFVSHAGPRALSALEVYVEYEGLDGNAHRLTLARVTAGGDWQPSIVIPLGVNALSAASANGWTAVRFGFTARSLLPGESYSLDGLYVDPFRSR